MMVFISMACFTMYSFHIQSIKKPVDLKMLIDIICAMHCLSCFCDNCLVLLALFTSFDIAEHFGDLLESGRVRCQGLNFLQGGLCPIGMGLAEPLCQGEDGGDG